MLGTRARDYTLAERKFIVLYEAVLDEFDIGSGTLLLDVGCGPGLFLRLAAQRRATVAGIDAAPEFIEIARERLPDADLMVGEMETLPYADDSFDVITGFDAFQSAPDPGRALHEAARVGRPGAPIVVSTWGPVEQCEAAAYVDAVGALLRPELGSELGPFALSEPGALERFAARAGLRAGAPRDVECVWEFVDDAEALTALGSTGLAVRAAEITGEDAVCEAVMSALAPYRTSTGGYRIENTFTYMEARA